MTAVSSRVLHRRWKSIALATVAGAGAAAAITAVLPPVYRAEAFVHIRRSRTDETSLDLDSVRAVAGALIALMTTDAALSEAAREVGLVTTSGGEPSQRVLQRVVEIRLRHGTPLLEFVVDWHDPTQAAAMANLLVERASHRITEQNRQGLQDSLEALAEETQGSRGKWDAARVALERFDAESGLVLHEAELERITRRIISIKNEVAVLEVERIQLQVESDKATRLLDTTPANRVTERSLVDDDAYRAFVSATTNPDAADILGFRLRDEHLNPIRLYLEDTVTVRSVRIEGIQQRLIFIKEELARVQIQHQELIATVARLRSERDILAKVLVTYSTAYESAAHREALQRLSLLDLQQVARIVERAVPPLRPLERMLRALAIGALAGLLLATLGAFIAPPPRDAA